MSHSPILLSSYPWEYILDNTKTFRFIILNFSPDNFSPSAVESIGKNLTRYIKKYVFPSWRLQIQIQYFTPPSQETLINQSTIPGAYINPIPQPGTFIPIYLVDEFSPNIENNFATGVHGTVSGSVMNGISALHYLNNELNQYGPLPFGTPFIVIPAGSKETNNGIYAEMKNIQRPSDFYQCLSLILCHHVIEILIDPTGVSYIGAGNPLDLNCSGLTVSGTQIFYLKQAVTPFSQGCDNLYLYHGWTMTNFAYPAYFFPYNKSGIYDFLGRSPAPFVPYQGTQFILYQDKNSPEFQVGKYISSIKCPRNVKLILNGSIYTYENWGLISEIPVLNRIELTFKTQVECCHNGKGLACGVYPHRTPTFSQNHDEGVKFITKYKKKRTSFDPTLPQLLPFTYLDHGVLTARFAIINYTPLLLPPKLVDNAVKGVEKYMRDTFLPYWNIQAKFVGNYTINSKSDLPIFDGTFIPFFILQYKQFNFEKLGGLVAPGGATNVNNNPNILAGPCISEYVLDPPTLPVGCPYLMVSDANFPQNVIITTDVPGVGPFIGAPSGSSRNLTISYPIVGSGSVAAPDISGCVSPLESMEGKIGLNIRLNCNSAIYPQNMEAAGAIATITVYEGGAVAFSAPGATKFNCTIGSEGLALIDAVKENPNLKISISSPTAPTDFGPTINIFTSIIAHEAMELAVDPSYANFIATSNPPVDRSILFSQYEASDAVESLNLITTLKTCSKSQSYRMNAFPNPSYFVANLRTNNYDNTGTIYAPLIPQSRQQIVYQVIDQPLQVGYCLGLLSGGDPNLTLDTFGSIFDPQTFYPPGNPYSYQNGGYLQPVPDSPMALIYHKLLTQNNVFLI